MNNSETESWSNYLNILLCTIEIQIWWCLCGFKTTASFTTYLTSWTQNKALIKEKRILSDFWCFLYHVPGKSSEFSSGWKSLFFWLPQTLVCLRPLDGVCVEGIEVGWVGLKGTRSPPKKASWWWKLQDLSRRGWAQPPALVLSSSSFQPYRLYRPQKEPRFLRSPRAL